VELCFDGPGRHFFEWVGRARMLARRRATRAT
jgi:hypothetical protein